MILLQRSMTEGLQSPTPESVRKALQNAVELEHATIPVYLYGLYSLDPARNAAIVAILESVVVEEMLHMALAANVLNALGGSPSIDRPDFIPSYPGPLPGGVASDLIVHLKPFSSDQLSTYLQIEEPENPIDIPLEAAKVAESITIGQFYTAISQAIGVLGDGAFVDPPRHQVASSLMPEAIVVTNVATAQAAIGTIIEQGEGTSTSPEESAASDEPAHYYRFMQILAGRVLEPAPGKTPPWAYSGAPVLLDVEGIYPLPDDPKAAKYPAGSAQAFANDNFNYTYTNLLKVLHGLFNGQNDRTQMNDAIALMMSLKGQAKAMMAGIPNPSGPYTGPSFEYQPVNPAAR